MGDVPRSRPRPAVEEAFDPDYEGAVASEVDDGIDITAIVTDPYGERESWRHDPREVRASTPPTPRLVEPARAAAAAAPHPDTRDVDRDVDLAADRVARRRDDAPSTTRTTTTHDSGDRAFARRALIGAAIVLCLGVSIALTVRVLDVLILFFAGILIAVFLCALTAPLARILRIGHRPALVITTGVLTALAVLLARSLLPALVEQTMSLTSQLPGTLRHLSEWLATSEVGQRILDTSPSNLTDQLVGLAGRLRSVITTTLGIGGTLFVAVLIGVFIAWDPGLYVQGALHLVPRRGRARAMEVLVTVHRTLKSWLLARAIAMLAVGTLTSIALVVLRVPYALALGAIAGMSSFVPFLGFLFSGLLIVLFALAEGPTHASIVVGMYLAIQWIENHFVTPIVEYQVVRVPPALSIVAQIILGILLGFIGVLFASPLFASIFVALRMLYVEDLLGDDTGAWWRAPARGHPA